MHAGTIPCGTILCGTITVAELEVALTLRPALAGRVHDLHVRLIGSGPVSAPETIDTPTNPLLALGPHLLADIENSRVPSKVHGRAELSLT